jgi:hypothetical protein
MLIILLSIVSGICYRIGGQGAEENPWANSQYRDIGCPVIVFGYLLTLGVTWYLALLSALAILGLIRTYYDRLGGFNKNNDNMYLHGAGIGLSMIPLCWDGVSWIGIVAYTAILALTMGGLNTLCTRVSIPKSVWIEECYRGAVLIAAIPVIFWG